MEKLKSFLNSYFWLIALIFPFVIGTLVFSIASAYQEQRFQKSITAGSAEAGKSKNEAANANTNAAGFDVSRRTEDVIREKTIAPKLREARRRSNNSKLELEKAKRKLDETNKTLHNSNVSRADNCLQLRQLFPDEKFAYCQ